MDSTNQPNHEPGAIVPGTIGDVIRAWGTTPDEWGLLGPVEFSDTEAIRFVLTSNGTWNLERHNPEFDEWYVALAGLTTIVPEQPTPTRYEKIDDEGQPPTSSFELTVPGTEGTGYPTLRIELPANEQPSNDLAALDRADLAADVRIYVQTGVHYDRGDYATYTIRGKRLLHRPDRDRPVIYADGVRLIAGTLPGFGGSKANPRIDPSDDARIEIADVSQGMYRHIVTEEDESATWSLEPTPRPKPDGPEW